MENIYLFFSSHFKKYLDSLSHSKLRRESFTHSVKGDKNSFWPALHSTFCKKSLNFFWNVSRKLVGNSLIIRFLRLLGFYKFVNWATAVAVGQAGVTNDYNTPASWLWYQGEGPQSTNLLIYFINLFVCTKEPVTKAIHPANWIMIWISLTGSVNQETVDSDDYRMILVEFNPKWIIITIFVLPDISVITVYMMLCVWCVMLSPWLPLHGVGGAGDWPLLRSGVSLGASDMAGHWHGTQVCTQDPTGDSDQTDF